MCHSVEMYMPQLTRGAVEHRLGAADFAAARRERAFFGAGHRVLARFGDWVVGAARGCSQGRASVTVLKTLRVSR